LQLPALKASVGVATARADNYGWQHDVCGPVPVKAPVTVPAPFALQLPPEGAPTTRCSDRAVCVKAVSVQTLVTEIPLSSELQLPSEKKSIVA
jgi:hypothetical protein